MASAARVRPRRSALAQGALRWEQFDCSHLAHHHAKTQMRSKGKTAGRRALFAP